nr:NB-ARC domains-containing protein [Tanacetum cinerariifolium]
MQEPREQHMKAIRQVLRYVKGTKDYGITYKHNGGDKIHGFSDSSYRVNNQEGKGTTRIIFYYGESPISWSTQKQDTVALSSCESEFIAATTASIQALWLKRLLSKLTHSEEEKITIIVDNKSAIALMKNPIFHRRSKHIDTKYHFIRECVEREDIQVEFIYDKAIVIKEENVGSIRLGRTIWMLKDEGGILPALRLSYHDLSACLKQLFAYCCLIPKDYVFEKKDLILLWMADGFLHNSATNKTIECLGEEYFQELLSRPFFQHAPDDESLFVMHDLMNDLAMFVAGEFFSRPFFQHVPDDESLFVMHDLMNDLAMFVAGEFFSRLDIDMQKNVRKKAFKKYRHISFYCDEYMTYNKFKAFERANSLRTFLAMPDVLNNWQTFYLSSKILVDLLPRLPLLRVLSLSRLKIVELTTLLDNFLKLRNLRHFDIWDTLLWNMMPLEIGEIKSLQTLSNKVVVVENDDLFISWLRNLKNLQGDIYIDELQKVQSARDIQGVNLSQKRVSELHMEWIDVFDDSQNEKLEKEVLDALKPHSDNLKDLVIESYRGKSFPNWIGDPSFLLLTNVRIEKSRNCMNLPPLGELPLLKKLDIQELNEVKVVGLEFLGEVGAVTLPCLEELHIKDCPNLAEVSLEELPSLRVLNISDCGDRVLRSLVHVTSSITKLSISDISGLGDEVWRGEELSIWMCNEIRYLWESEAEASKVLVNLRKLQVVNCSKLVSLGEKEEDDGCNQLTSLRILELGRCENLERCKLPNSIEELTIYGCPLIASVSIPTGEGHKLKSLYVGDCEQLLEKGARARFSPVPVLADARFARCPFCLVPVPAHPPARFAASNTSDTSLWRVSWSGDAVLFVMEHMSDLDLNALDARMKSLTKNDGQSDPIVQSVDINTNLTFYAGAAGTSAKDQPKVNSNFRTLVADPVFDGVNISFPRKVVEKEQLGETWAEKDNDEFQRLFFFKFDFRDGLKAVLEGGPWLICKSLIILKKWSMNTRLLKEELTRISIWVKFHDVPIHVFEEDGISLIATFIGKPVMLDSYTSSMCNESWGRSSFARDGFTKETIRIEYEWRPPRCDMCKIFGHVHDHCPKKMVSPSIVTTSNVVISTVDKTNDGFQTVGKKKKRKENGNAPIVTKTVDGKETVILPISVEEKAQKRAELKAKSTLLMALPNENHLKFNSYKDAKTLMQAIKNRFGVIEQTYERIQKLISQLEMHDEVIPQEEINQKFLRSLSQEWTMHTIVWRNKSEIKTLSLDDLFNNLKAYESEVMGTSSSTKNSHKNTGRKLDMANTVIIGFDKSKVECFNCHKRGQFARECRAPKNQDNENEEPIRRTVPVEATTSNALVSQCDGLSYDWSDQVEEDDFVNVNESVSESVVEKPTIESNEPKTVKKENRAPIIED